MFEWLKKHKILIVIISIIVILGIPFLIHILFKIHPHNNFFVAEWTAGDLLSYYGSILAFLGTVILGALALYQNSIIKEESDRRNALIEQREHDSNMPKFSAAYTLANGNIANLRFEIKNISENIANELAIYEIKILKPNNDVFWKSDKSYSFSSISSESSVKIELSNPAIYENGYIFSMEMCAKDKYNEQHTYMIRGICEKVNDFPKFKIIEIS